MKAIMYHYVREYSNKLHNLKFLHVDDFKKQLDFFEKEYGFISKRDFYQAISAGEPMDGIVLTFDDNLSCQYDYVFPELVKRGLWGIFYISSLPYLENRLLDVHKIHVLTASIEPTQLKDSLLNIVEDRMIRPEHRQKFSSATYRSQKNDSSTLTVKRILNYYLGYEFKHDVLDKLWKVYKNEEVLASSYYITIKQMQEMKAAGMVIGNHTVSHPVLSRLNKEEQSNEIKKTNDFLDLKTISDISRTFCFPYGGYHSFNDETIEILEKENCSYAFNVEPRDVSESDLKNKPLMLPR